MINFIALSFDQVEVMRDVEPGASQRATPPRTACSRTGFRNTYSEHFLPPAAQSARVFSIRVLHPTKIAKVNFTVW